MRTTALLLLAVLAAAPARAGDLVHYRLPDGRTGWTDTAAKVPAGAVVVTEHYRAPDTLTKSEVPQYQVPELNYSGRSWKDAAQRSPLAGLTESVWRMRARAAEHSIDRARGDVTFWDACAPQGLWKTSPCNAIGVQSREAALERLQNAKRYQADLEEDCRRTPGCLPGYVRD